MVTPAEIGWGKYHEWEGPYFRGSREFVMPAEPSNAYKILEVITTTEGGKYDAVNMYDRCIVSCGLIQWCEASYFLTSKLLGAIFSKNPDLLGPLEPALTAAGAEFGKDVKDRWMFHVKQGDLIDERGEQTDLFFLNSNGQAGTWDQDSMERAKLWASCFANVLAQDEAEGIQAEYTANRVKTFSTAEAQAVIWDGLPDEGLVGAVRAAFLSFAANLPAVASKHLLIAVGATTAPKWSEDWCVQVLKELTFGPGITIYPGRYDKIRKVLERNYSVDLPDFSQDLKTWRDDLHKDCPPSSVTEPGFEDPKEIQQLLIDLGFDLGPSGADGKIGPKSQDAILMFQRTNGLLADGVVGKKTRAKMVEAWRRIHPI